MAKPSRSAPAVSARNSEPKSQAAIQTVISSRSGPLPTPVELAAYNELLPGTAERIIAMAEREQAARHNADDQAQRADISHRDEMLAAQKAHTRSVFVLELVGQIFGVSVALACTAGAVYTAVVGAHPVVSVALVGLPIAAIIKALRGGGSKKVIH
jgi:uncharacterized membrane protein